ncbi:MAG: hypothetical protein JWM21_1333 [Acidobacteria bacterium]|nr:hypothetical protein [Acidobacteriota bacterium]
MSNDIATRSIDIGLMSTDLVLMSLNSGWRLTDIGLMLVQFVPVSIGLDQGSIVVAVRSTEGIIVLIKIAVMLVATTLIWIDTDLSAFGPGEDQMFIESGF